MKFKLDENLPQELASDIIEIGHDAETVVTEGMAGDPDTCYSGRLRPAVVKCSGSSGVIFQRY